MHLEFSHIGPIHVVIKVETDWLGKWKTEWRAGNTGRIKNGIRGFTCCINAEILLNVAK